MPARTKASGKVEVPFLLSEAVKNGRAILFLGAGASKECKNGRGETPPNAEQLRDIISQKYLGKLMPKRDLMSVAEMAIETAAGQNLVFETVSNAFDGFETSEAHKLTSEFNWRAIATTNYDLFMEAAYSDPKRRRQVLIPFVKDDEPVDARKGAVAKPVEYLKLHGCLNHRLDKDIPLVLSWEQYAEYSQNRAHLFNRLAYLSHECPIIFVGYGMADQHIRNLVYRLESNARPRWYIVDPAAEDEDVRFWNTKNFDVLVCRFGEFMTALDEAVPKLLRFLTPSTESVNFPLKTFYTSSGAIESDSLRSSFTKDLTLVHASMAFAEQTADRFYSGYDTGWGGILNRFDARRRVTDDLLFKAILENENPKDPVFFLLRGPAGAGKTIALKRAAFDAATANKALVLWLEERGQLRPEIFIEIAELVQQPIFLFVDQVALQVEKIVPLLKVMKSRHIPLVLIGAEREADWTTYCEALERIQTPQFMRVGMLSTVEVELLLDLLERHGCLGELKEKTRAAQVEAFMGESHANRQLLVALHELTRGYPFEQIVLDEYERVPEKARRLYLDIATMHQFSVPVRAGTISRVSGIDFRDYKNSFLEPLKDMVTVEEDKYGDYAYKTRHPSIAAMIFRQVCADDASKSAQFIRLIEGFDIGYSTDKRTLDAICKGRILANQFQNPDPARDIFSTATDIAPNQAYLFQQWAIFESSHRQGDMQDAERLAETAAVMEPGNSSFIHTQAEVARKRANIEESAVLKEQLRRQTRMLLDKMPRQDRFTVSSRCKLLVDEVADLSDSLGDDERPADERFFADKLREVESALTKAQQQFPEDAEMVETEARLWNLMKDKRRALLALERALKKMPRGSGTAIRISKIYATAGRRNDEYQVLSDALNRDPEDKPAHLAMAMHLIAADEWDKNRIIFHLRGSYQVNDANFEARYILAQFLFAVGDVSDSVGLFSEIATRAPREFRRFAPKIDNLITTKLPSYTGTIEDIRDGYSFIRSGAHPNRIIAHRSAFEDSEADEVEVGQQVFFRVRFNRVGPAAVSVHLKPTGWGNVVLEEADNDDGDIGLLQMLN